MLDLTTLGTVDLSRDDERVLSVLSQPTRLAFLTYLAVGRPRGPHRRDALTLLLWPDRDDARARRALRQTLHRLRRSLGTNVLTGFGEESVGLSPGALRCDAVAFEEALDEGRPAEALELYGGSFLNGFHLPDAREFESWMDAERRRLARRARDAARDLVDDAAEEDPAAATEWARRAIAVDPYDESAWRRLFALMDRRGDRAGALRAYERLAGRLEEELGIEPSPETRAAVENIRGRQRAHAGASTGDGGTEAAGEAAPVSAAPVGPAGESAGVDPGETARLGIRLSSPPARILAATLAVLALGGLTAVALPHLSGGGGSETAASGGDGSAELPGGALADSPEDQRPAVAVLPFTNVGGDPDDEYFSDGLTEELIGVLAGVEDLRVVARTSTFAFREEDRDIREIGRALDVTAVVEGSVRKEGDRIRVAAQLIDGADGFHLWSEIYDRELTDVFEIQEDLALRIADALETELTPRERRRLADRSTENLEAYHHYLRGRYFWNQRNYSGLSTAIEYFERAIEADSTYAAAYAGLASVYAPTGELGYLHPAEGRERMENAARRALELDGGSAEARTVLGASLHVYQWDWEAAERAYRRAIELDPEYATARLWYGYLLMALGRFEEASAQLTEAVALEPLTPIMTASLASSHRLAGRIDMAMELYGDALELDPGFWLGLESVGKVHEARGEPERAVRSFERAVDHAGPTPRPKAGLARALALSGRTDEAREMLAELRAHADESDLYFPEVATVFEALGDGDAAFDWLERSYQQRHVRLQHIGVDASFDRLRDDPRFRDLLERIGLPAAGTS